MKVRIEDKEALDALSWEALKAYLDRADGWKCAEDIPGKAAVYQRTDKKSRRLREIVVPIRRDFADYAARMGDAVETLARVEDRSELDVYEDLRRLGTHAPQVDDATRAVHEKIRRWMAEEHWHVREVSNPDFSLSIVVTLESGQSLDIFQHRGYVDRITVAQQWRLDESFGAEFSKLPDSARLSVIQNIYRDVLTSGLDLAGLDDSLTEIRYGTFIYFDGLTKDALIQRILLVVRMHHLTMRTFGRAFVEAGYLSEAASKLLHLVPMAGGPQAVAG